MKYYKILSVLACALALAGMARAADETKTIIGEASYAIQPDPAKSQIVIQAKVADKTVNYYVVNNPIADTVRGKIRDAAKPVPVTATGTIKTVDGKQELTATKIEVKK